MKTRKLKDAGKAPFQVGPLATWIGFGAVDDAGREVEVRVQDSALQRLDLSSTGAGPHACSRESPTSYSKSQNRNMQTASLKLGVSYQSPRLTSPKRDFSGANVAQGDDLAVEVNHSKGSMDVTGSLRRMAAFAQLSVPCRRKSRPNWPQVDWSFERLEENAGGVPEEEFPVSDVAREHGVRGVAGLLPDLERRDARPSSRSSRSRRAGYGPNTR